jgi:hypothetical protein
MARCIGKISLSAAIRREGVAFARGFAHDGYDRKIAAAHKRYCSIHAELRGTRTGRSGRRSAQAVAGGKARFVPAWLASLLLGRN